MNRRGLIIGVAAGVAVLVIWLLVLWFPRSNAIDEARERRDVAEQQVEELELRLARLRELQENAPRLQARLEELRAAVPEQPDLAQFILAANEAANQSGIEFISVTPSVPTPGETPAAPAEIALDISIAGGYFQVLDFLNRVTALDRLVVVENVNISATPLAGTVELQTTIAARMFVTEVVDAVQPGQPGATTTTVPAGETGPTTTEAL